MRQPIGLVLSDNHVLGAVLRKRGIGFAGLYACRRSCATIVTELTNSPFAAQAVLRHSNVSTTLIFYYKPERERLAQQGDPVPKQTWGKMLANEIYCGWVVSGDLRVQGTHDPLISEKVFKKIQERIGGNRSVPHQVVHDEFPLRSVVLCAGCQKPLTAGTVRGKKKKPYPRYWCWNKACTEYGKGAGADTLHAIFVGLLERMTPGTKGLGMIPEIAARELEERKERIAKDVAGLRKKIADQDTLYQRAMDAMLQGIFSKEDFVAKKAAIEAEKEELKSKLNGLDSEVPALEELKEQVRVQLFDLKKAWEKATTAQKHEIVKGLFPEGLRYSSERGYFILEGTPLYSSVYAGMMHALEEFPAESNFGVPDGI